MSNDENRNWDGSFNNSIHNSYTQNQAGVNWNDSIVSADRKVWEYESNQRRIQEEDNNRMWQQYNNNHQFTQSNHDGHIGSFSGRGYVGSAPSSLDLSWISSLFYFFFWFIPQLVFYYMPIKHFFKFLLAVIFAVVAYTATNSLGERIRSHIQRTIVFQPVVAKPAEYYGVNPKYLNQYRALSAKGLADRSRAKMSDSQEAAYYAVLKERLLADPTFFDTLRISESMKDIEFYLNVCSQAHRYFYVASNNKKISNEQQSELAMEQGSFYFSQACVATFPMPASQFVSEAGVLQGSEKYQAEYNRIKSDLRFQLTRNTNVVDLSYALYALALILFVVIIVQSHRFDCVKRAAKKLAKQEAAIAKAEAEKPATEETEATVTAKT